MEWLENATALVSSFEHNIKPVHFNTSLYISCEIHIINESYNLLSAEKSVPIQVESQTASGMYYSAKSHLAENT